MSFWVNDFGLFSIYVVRYACVNAAKIWACCCCCGWNEVWGSVYGQWKLSLWLFSCLSLILCLHRGNWLAIEQISCEQFTQITHSSMVQYFNWLSWIGFCYHSSIQNEQIYSYSIYEYVIRKYTVKMSKLTILITPRTHECTTLCNYESNNTFMRGCLQ